MEFNLNENELLFIHIFFACVLFQSGGFFVLELLLKYCVSFWRICNHKSWIKWLNRNGNDFALCAEEILFT